MAGTTPNFGFQLLDPSQSQPEVPINFDLDKLDTLLAAVGGSVSVREFGDSPAIEGVTELIFQGVTVTGESGGRVLLQVEGFHETGTPTIALQLACSDLITDIANAAGVAYVRAPSAFTLTDVRASLQTASSSGAVTVDIKKNGVTVLSTALSIDATENTSTTAATPAVISVSAIADDDELSIDITGAGTGAKGLIVSLLGV